MNCGECLMRDVAMVPLVKGVCPKCGTDYTDVTGDGPKWIIRDWAGNRMFPDRTFDTFEDGWEFIRGQFPDENDWQEMYVERSN